MSDNNDWVEDVKRWCRSGAEGNGMVRTDRGAALVARPADDEYQGALGYEAANPGLQARHWPGNAPGAVPIGR